MLSTEITAVFTENESGEEIDSQPLEKGDNDYVFGAPVVDSVTPEGGSLDGGTTILIDGSGFEDPGLTLESVAFAPLDDTDESDTLFASDTDVTILSDTQIEVKTPDASGPAGTSPTLDTEVTVVFSDETERTVLSVPAAQGDNDYTFGAPVVTAIDPEGGPVEGGNTITVLGSGFDDPDLQIDQRELRSRRGYRRIRRGQRGRVRYTRPVEHGDPGRRPRRDRPADRRSGFAADRRDRSLHDRRRHCGGERSRFGG